MIGVSAEQAVMPDVIFGDQQQNGPSVDMSQAMWRYKNLGLIGDYPVEDQAKDLPLDNIQDIEKALTLDTIVKTWTGYLSPDQQDKDNIEQYNTIQQGLTTGALSLIDQQKHFCPSTGKILVLVTYGQMLYRLNPRYKYLKGQINVRK